MFLRNSKRFFIENIFFAPSTGLSFSSLGMIGSKVKRKPICAVLAMMPIMAATTTKMKECLQTIRAAIPIAGRVAANGSPSSLCPT